VRRSLAQKDSGSPRRPFVEKDLSELMLISPRRDQLAWASLSVLATVFTCSRLEGIPQTTNPPYHTSITAGKLKQSQTTWNNRLVPNEQEGSSFPYLENKLATGSLGTNSERNSSESGLASWKTVEPD